MNENPGQTPVAPSTSTASRVEELSRRIESVLSKPVAGPPDPLPNAPLVTRPGPVPELRDVPQRAVRKAATPVPAGLSPPTPAPPPHLAQPGGLLEYAQMLRRRKWLLALTVILGGIIGLVVLLPQTPVFRAETTIEVLDMNTGIVGMKDGFSANNPTDATNLQTQVEIIGSASLQQRVVAKLVSSERTIEQPVDRLEKLRRVLNLPSKPLMSKEDILKDTSAGIAASASASNRIIRVDCDSSNPKVAADYVNTLADEFINERLESHWQATQRTSEYLTKQLEELKVRLMASEDALQG